MKRGCRHHGIFIAVLMVHGIMGCTHPQKAWMSESLFTVCEKAGVWPIWEMKPTYDSGGWTFFQGYVGDVPVMRLYAQKESELHLIRRPEDMCMLSGVAVRNKEQCKGLIQYFTKPDNFFLFQWPYAIDINIQGGEAGEYGVVPNDIYTDMGLSPISIQASSNGFTVRRDLLMARVTNNQYAVMRVTEQVMSNGCYKLLSSEIIGRIPCMKTRVPYFE